MASSSEVMLEEMRHAFDTTYESAKKYANKTLMAFGAEITLLVFYLAADEMKMIKILFADIICGWWLFAALALIAFVVAATLFIISMALDAKWQFPPDPVKLVDDGEYGTMEPETLRRKLISEYNRDIKFCIKKIVTMKTLTNIGIYCLAAGVICLLLIKFFGV